MHPREERRSGELELFVKKVAIVAAVVILLGLLWLVRDILVLVFIAAVLAAGIEPAVHRVRVYGRFWLHRNVRRGTAVAVVYLPFLILVLALALILVPRLIADVHALSAQLPALLERNLLQPLSRYVSVEPIRQALRDGIHIERSSVFAYVRSAATAMASVIAILFMVAYMLMDAHRLRNLVLLFYPADVRADRRRVLSRMARRMSSWLSAQLILAVMMGTVTFCFLLILRLPYALPLAILAMLGEMVPVIGPILGTTPALMIAILASRWQFWSMLIFAIVAQKLENLFVAPRIMSKKVSMSPLAVFIAFMIGGTLMGIVGAILAVPVAAIIQVAFDEIFVSRRERRQDSDRAGTLLRRVD